MDGTAGSDGAAASAGDVAGRLVALRGELWQRHTQLRGAAGDPTRYEEQATALIALTTQLLRVEAQVSALTRTARRRTSWVGFTLAAVLLVGAAGTVLAAPVIGARVAWLAAGATLLAVLVVLLATALVRRRHAPPGLSRSTSSVTGLEPHSAVERPERQPSPEPAQPARDQSSEAPEPGGQSSDQSLPGGQSSNQPEPGVQPCDQPEPGGQSRSEQCGEPATQRPASAGYPTPDLADQTEPAEHPNLADHPDHPNLADHPDHPEQTEQAGLLNAADESARDRSEQRDEPGTDRRGRVEAKPEPARG